MQIVLLKTFVGLTWLAALAAALAPLDPSLASVAATGRLVVSALAVIHAVECVVFLPALRRLGEPLPGQLLQTFVFGVSHYAWVRVEIERRGDGSDGR